MEVLVGNSGIRVAKLQENVLTLVCLFGTSWFSFFGGLLSIFYILFCFLWGFLREYFYFAPFFGGGHE